MTQTPDDVRTRFTPAWETEIVTRGVRAGVGELPAVPAGFRRVACVMNAVAADAEGVGAIVFETVDREEFAGGR